MTQNLTDFVMEFSDFHDKANELLIAVNKLMEKNRQSILCLRKSEKADLSAMHIALDLFITLIESRENGLMREIGG